MRVSESVSLSHFLPIVSIRCLVLLDLPGKAWKDEKDCLEFSVGGRLDIVTSSGWYSGRLSFLPDLNSFSLLIPRRSLFWWPNIKNPMSSKSSMEIDRTSLTLLYPCAARVGQYWDKFNKCIISSTEWGTCCGNQSCKWSLSISDLIFFRWCGFFIPIAVRSSGVLK